MLTEILIVLLLILANGFFSGAEMAIVASRRGRLRAMAEQGDRRAKAALELASSPDRFLPTVQIGITLVGTLAAAYGGDRLVSGVSTWISEKGPPALATAARPIALTVFVMLLSFVTLLFGELVPKRLALRKAEAFARLAAPTMQLFAWVARPLVWGMSLATSAMLFLLGAGKQTEPSVSVDDIEHLLQTGRAEGVLEAVEQAVASEALRLGEKHLGPDHPLLVRRLCNVAALYSSTGRPTEAWPAATSTWISSTGRNRPPCASIPAARRVHRPSPPSE